MSIAEYKIDDFVIFMHNLATKALDSSQAIVY